MLVRLQAQAPLRVFEAELSRQALVLTGTRAVHWLQEKVSKVESFEAMRWRVFLRVDEFEFVSMRLV